jgi:hypothetical protein
LGYEHVTVDIEHSTVAVPHISDRKRDYTVIYSGYRSFESLAVLV